MLMDTKNRRIIGLDFVKGICIILVVLDHSVIFDSFPVFVGNILRAVFLNGFFAVSGFVLYQNNQKITQETLTNMLRKRFRSLIIPYISFSILAVVWHTFLCVGLGCREISNSYFGWTLVLRDVFCMLSGLGIGTLWFLPVLFFTYALLVITVFAVDSVKSKSVILVIFTIISAYLAVYLKNSHLEVYFFGMLRKIVEEYTYMCYRIVNGYSFALFGYLLHMMYSSRRDLTWIAICGFVMMCLFSATLNFGLTGILLLGSICAINRDTIRGGWYNPVRFMTYCGEHSLAITIYHYIFLLPLEIMILKALGFVGSGWLLFVVNLVSTLLVVQLLDNNRLTRFLLTGKRLVQ